MAYVAAMARVRALEERLGIAGTETGTDGDETDAAPGRRKAAIAFWDGLLWKVFDRMGAQHLDADSAYLLLDPETHREAEGWCGNRKWSAAVLGDKMKGRAKEGKLFAALGSGLYRRMGDEVDAAEGVGARVTPSDPVSNVPAEQLKAVPTRSKASKMPEPQPSKAGRRIEVDAPTDASARPGGTAGASRVPLHSLTRLARHRDVGLDDDGMDKIRFTIDGQSITKRRAR